MPVFPRSWLTAFLAAAFVAVIAFRYAEPISDGDLFWHMAYARQMSESGSLVLDHSIYSWTPASNRMIYCAWAAELELRWLWENLGLWSLFCLRYAVILFCAWLFCDFARRLGLARLPATWLVLLITALVSVAGTLIKPELFSLLFMSALVVVFYRGKHATLTGGNTVRWFYAAPIIMLLWVNHHGAFILSAPFLLATALGEGIALRFGKTGALPARVYAHLVAAWALCGAATLITPYGARYPAQLFADYVLHRTPRPDAAWNQAYQTIFHESAQGGHFVGSMIVMLALLLTVIIMRARSAPRGARFDWTTALVNLAYVPLYIIWLRTTWVWAPVFACSFFFSLWQARQWQAAPDEAPKVRRLPMLASSLAVIAYVFIGARGVMDAWQRPDSCSWMGFGVSCINPVAEAEFVSKSKLGPRLINLFDGGGYLLWRLWPQCQVMVDSRSFPYLDWFQEQYDFAHGRHFEEFIAKYPADTAVIDLTKDLCWRKFLRAPGWRPAFFGPSAVVFVRDSVKSDQLTVDVAPHRFEELRSADAAVRAFWFAAAIADFKTAWQLQSALDTRLRRQVLETDALSAQRYREAHAALRSGDFARADRLFLAALTPERMSDRDRLIRTFLDGMATIAREGRPPAEAEPLKAALARLAAPES